MCSANASGATKPSASSWADLIISNAAAETRTRPWVKEFGVPVTDDVDAEDWIEYPAKYDVSKKGISG
jgi:hypothetical protein